MVNRVRAIGSNSLRVFERFLIGIPAAYYLLPMAYYLTYCTSIFTSLGTAL